ncbi:hypothetical protein HLH17_16355 [Acinetobacter sp. ANC 5380]|uniref:Uncharacterized protein n=1 Tax=Acinetobacter terrae TaxID=2731247 RepID=A0A7Y2WCB2_9GAMM|nr:hypothetical protein [Acinetobacter terrae]NNH79190.1 hypothetical protein [Acinetobacter terrae]
MYRTFDLLQKSLYIIGFWSLIFYILEARKFGRDFIEVAAETILGVGIFGSILILFVFYITSVHRKTRSEKLLEKTKNVVEDGMIFTVGGHTKLLPVLPDSYLVESQVLTEFEREYAADSDSLDHLTLERSQKLKEVLDRDDSLDLVSEQEVLEKKESLTQHDEEDNSPIKAIKDQYTNSHESRRMDKGLLAYKHQFNLLYSHILNYELFALNKDIKNGTSKLSGNAVKEKKKQLQEKSQLLQIEIEESISKVLKAVKDFKYTGVVTTTPQIKARRQLDFSDYQLVNFTALFPFIDWLSLRSALALNNLDPEFKATLSSTELKKIESGELGLSLRDKRILWNAKRMYEIYLKRDKDLAVMDKSSYNMPISFDKNGQMYNPLEEPVGLCELLRFSQTVQMVTPTKAPVSKESQAPYSENDVLRLVFGLLTEKGRFNTNNNSRVGIIKDGLIYLNMAEFLPKFNGRFKETYPNIANQVEYKKALNMFYYKLKKMSLLGMRLMDDDSDLIAETYVYKTDGELFRIFFEFKSDNATFENGLIIHAAKMFKDIAANYKEYHVGIKILGLSDTSAIPASPHADKIQKLIQAHEKKQKNIKEMFEIQTTEKPIEVSPEQVVQDLNSEIQQVIPDPLESEFNVEETPSQPSKESKQPTPKKHEAKVAGAENLTSYDVLDVLDELDISVIDEISKNAFSGGKEDLLIANKNLESAESKSKVVSAYQYIHREVQVVSLKKASSQNSSGVNKVFAVNELNKKALQLVECSRSDINLAAKNLNFTILKLMDAQMKNTLKDDVFSHTAKSKHLLIPKDKVYKLFNVVEQMALYQKKGSSQFWSIREDEYKGSEDKDFSQIRVIECIQIDKAQEDNFYKKMRHEMWTKDKAEELFKEIKFRLESMSEQDKRKYGFKKSADGQMWLIPRQHIGQLKRTSIQINSFLAYTNQFKNNLSGDLKAYATQLESYVFAETTYIRFGKAEK